MTTLPHRRPAPTGPALAPHRPGQAGAVGGVEVLPFGVLIFVAGTLLVSNAWAVVDARTVVGEVVREAGRTYAESSGSSYAADRAVLAGEDVLRGYGRNPDHLSIQFLGPQQFGRCGRVTVEATYSVPSVRLPFGRDLGRRTVRARHTELIDPLRHGLTGEAGCGA